LRHDQPALGTHLLQKLLPEFGDLRRDHGLTVRLTRVVGEVILVVPFRRIECRERLDLGHDRIVVQLLRLHLGDGFARNPRLVIRVREDDGAILRADVAALTILRRRIVNREEHVE